MFLMLCCFLLLVVVRSLVRRVPQVRLVEDLFQTQAVDLRRLELELELLPTGNHSLV